MNLTIEQKDLLIGLIEHTIENLSMEDSMEYGSTLKNIKEQLESKSEIKKCCDKDMIHLTEEDMTGTYLDLYLCPYCFSFEKKESGDLDFEDVCNWLGVDSDKVPEELEDDDLGNYFTEMWRKSQ